jgi:plastocyanin
MRRFALVACVCVATLVAASCGGGSGYSAPTGPTTGGGGGTTGGSNVITITIKGVNGKLSFDPNPASVQAGQVVVFKNADVVTHHVTLDDRSMETGDIPAGATSQPLAIGAINKAYHCTLHPSMVGSFNAAATPDPPPCTGYCG